MGFGGEYQRVNLSHFIILYILTEIELLANIGKDGIASGYYCFDFL